MIAKLKSMNSSDSAEVIPLERLPVTLGRGADADVRISDRFASRLHCRIVQVENQLVVQDLGSMWGTLVNGQPMVEAPLKPGDALTVGISTFRIEPADSTYAFPPIQIGALMKKLTSILLEPSP